MERNVKRKRENWKKDKGKIEKYRKKTKIKREWDKSKERQSKRDKYWEKETKIKREKDKKINRKKYGGKERNIAEKDRLKEKK